MRQQSEWVDEISDERNSWMPMNQRPATLPTFTRSRAQNFEHTRNLCDKFMFILFATTFKAFFVTLSDNKLLQQVVNWEFTGTQK